MRKRITQDGGINLHLKGDDRITGKQTEKGHISETPTKAHGYAAEEARRPKSL